MLQILRTMTNEKVEYFLVQLCHKFGPDKPKINLLSLTPQID